MRRLALTAALSFALLALGAVPAAAAALQQRVPANEILIARTLAKQGVIPSWATPVQVKMAVRDVLRLRQPPAYELKTPLLARTLDGKRSALGRYLTSLPDDGATTTYTSNTLVLLVDFGDTPWPSGDMSGHVATGPRAGSIDPPAADDNNTFWPGDASPSHYQRMLFGNSFPVYDADGRMRGTSTDTMKSYYLEQSRGAYTVSGDVAGWVTVPYPESWYGANAPDGWGDDLTGPVWRLARDAVAQLAAEQPDFPWAEYDRENPFGIVPGDFDQPDGIIDHLILVHAGVDESAGGGAEGPDAIWAHSWWVYDDPAGGPGGVPGYRIPGTSKWVGPYTVNPEDGAIGVFCHEFGHDLGLPDEYDTSYTGESPSGFWTLMSSGSWLGREWGLGTKPAPMNAWDKYTLGFITPRVVKRGKTARMTLQPAALGEAGKVAVKVNLPKAKHTVPLSGVDGAMEWYSTMGNDLDTTLTTRAKIAVSVSDPTLTLRTWYDIEEGYDWGFVNVSTDGTHWTTARSSATQDAGGGYWGLTGTDTDHWSDTVTYDLSAFAGASVYVQFEYWTDAAVVGRGWEVTDVKVSGTALGTTAFTADGWVRVDGRYVGSSNRYYIAEYRTWNGFDAALRDCYQFNPRYASYTDWFQYNRGLHVILRDDWYADNNVGEHRGQGGWMVVDARPVPDWYGSSADPVYWRQRIQVRDASFSLLPTPAQAIVDAVAPGKRAQPLFDDSRTYYYEIPDPAPGATEPLAFFGTKVPKNLGVRLQVKAMTLTGLSLYVDNVK